MGTALKTILIVEDEKDIRETLQEVLEIEGYQVFEAANGREALNRLAECPRPGLILLDLMMPVMNGWEFLSAIKEQQSLSSIPVVVVTAAGEAVRSSRVQLQGVKSIVKKPVDLDQLLQEIAVHFVSE
jgi:CheY-like chemotaxis protein